MASKNLFKYFKTSSETIRLAVMFYVRYPLSYRQVEDILHERGIDICHETVRFWVGRFGVKFANEIRKKRAGHHSNWQWHLDEVFVKINENYFRYGGPSIMRVKFWSVIPTPGIIDHAATLCFYAQWSGFEDVGRYSAL